MRPNRSRVALVISSTASSSSDRSRSSPVVRLPCSGASTSASDALDPIDARDPHVCHHQAPHHRPADTARRTGHNRHSLVGRGSFLPGCPGVSFCGFEGRMRLRGTSNCRSAVGSTSARERRRSPGAAVSSVCNGSSRERAIEVIWGNRLRPGEYRFLDGFPHFVADTSYDGLATGLTRRSTSLALSRDLEGSGAGDWLISQSFVTATIRTPPALATRVMSGLNGGEAPARLSRLVQGVNPHRARTAPPVRDPSRHPGPPRPSGQRSIPPGMRTDVFFRRSGAVEPVKRRR